MRTGGRYFQNRSYQIKPGPRRKFRTVLRLDGYWIKTLLSKSMKAAIAKGECHLSNYYNF